MSRAAIAVAVAARRRKRRERRRRKRVTVGRRRRAAAGVNRPHLRARKRTVKSPADPREALSARGASGDDLFDYFALGRRSIVRLPVVLPSLFLAFVGVRCFWTAMRCGAVDKEIVSDECCHHFSLRKKEVEVEQGRSLRWFIPLISICARESQESISIFGEKRCFLHWGSELVFGAYGACGDSLFIAKELGRYTRASAVAPARTNDLCLH